MQGVMHIILARFARADGTPAAQTAWLTCRTSTSQRSSEPQTDLSETRNRAKCRTPKKDATVTRTSASANHRQRLSTSRRGLCQSTPTERQEGARLAHGSLCARPAASTWRRVFRRKRFTGLHPVDMIRSPATEGHPASAAPAVRLRMAALLVRSASSKTSRLLRRGRIARGERCGREMHAARCRHSWDALPCRRRALSADSFPAQRLVHTRCQRTQLRDGAHTRAPDCPPQNRACTRRTRSTASVPGSPPPGRRLSAPGGPPRALHAAHRAGTAARGVHRPLHRCSA